MAVLFLRDSRQAWAGSTAWSGWSPWCVWLLRVLWAQRTQEAGGGSLLLHSSSLSATTMLVVIMAMLTSMECRQCLLHITLGIYTNSCPVRTMLSSRKCARRLVCVNQVFLLDLASDTQLVYQGAWQSTICTSSQSTFLTFSWGYGGGHWTAIRMTQEGSWTGWYSSGTHGNPTDKM